MTSLLTAMPVLLCKHKPPDELGVNFSVLVSLPALSIFLSHHYRPRALQH